jgi:hypothetical protein
LQIKQVLQSFAICPCYETKSTLVTGIGTLILLNWYTYFFTALETTIFFLGAVLGSVPWMATAEANGLHQIARSTAVKSPTASSIIRRGRRDVVATRSKRISSRLSIPSRRRRIEWMGVADVVDPFQIAKKISSPNQIHRIIIFHHKCHKQ